jgi:hypothetical protein
MQRQAGSRPDLAPEVLLDSYEEERRPNRSRDARAGNKSFGGRQARRHAPGSGSTPSRSRLSGVIPCAGKAQKGRRHPSGRSRSGRADLRRRGQWTYVREATRGNYACARDCDATRLGALQSQEF